MKRLLLLGPLPPPNGGDTLSFQRIVTYLTQTKKYKITVIKTNVQTHIRTLDTRISFFSKIKYVWVLLRICLAIPRHDCVLLCANARFMIRLTPLFSRIAAWSKTQFLIKPFGTRAIPYYESCTPRIQHAFQKALTSVQAIFPQTSRLATFFNNHFSCPTYPLANFIDGPPLTPNTSHVTSDFVFVGQVKKEKGIFVLLDAMKQCPKARLDIYGPLLPEDKSDLETQLELCPNVHYHGPVSNKDVIPLLQQYKATILPTIHPGEGYPGIILESFFAARPVISTSWLDIPDLVTSGKNGILVKAGDQQELVEAIDTITTFDKATFTTYCNHARETALGYTTDTVLSTGLVPHLDAIE